MKDNSKCKKELDINGDPIDPNKKYIGKKIKVPMASPSSSIYKNSATIIFKGKPVSTEDKKREKLLEFLSRAPISFDDE